MRLAGSANEPTAWSGWPSRTRTVVASPTGASCQPPSRTPRASISVTHASTAPGIARRCSSLGLTPSSTQMNSANFTTTPYPRPWPGNTAGSCRCPVTLFHYPGPLSHPESTVREIGVQRYVSDSRTTRNAIDRIARTHQGRTNSPMWPQESTVGTPNRPVLATCIRSSRTAYDPRMSFGSRRSRVQISPSRLAENAIGKPKSAGQAALLRDGPVGLLAMQKVEGSSPFSRYLASGRGSRVLERPPSEAAMPQALMSTTLSIRPRRPR